MRIDIIELAFTDSLNTMSSPFLIGSIGDKNKALISAKAVMETKETDLQFFSGVNKIVRTDGSWVGDGFKDNDLIKIYGTTSNNGNFTINYITDEEMYLTTAVVNETVTTARIRNVTPIKAIDLYYNLVENLEEDNFISKVDTKIQKLTASNVPIGIFNTPLVNYSNEKAWQSGESNLVASESKIITYYIDTSGTLDDGAHFFNLEHTFYITPLFLPSQVNNNALDFSLVDYLFSSKSLRYTFRLDLRSNVNDNTIDYSTDISLSEGSNISIFLRDGNVGWYNEKLNGQSASFSLQSITYKQGLNIVNALSSEYDTDVEILIKSQNNVFTTSNKCELQIIKAHTDLSTYQNESNLMFDNYERSFVSIQANNTPLANGNRNIFSGAKAQLINSSTIKITFKHKASYYNTGNYANDKVTGLLGNYIISVTTQSPTITDLKLTDKVNILCDYNSVSSLLGSEVIYTDGGISFNEHSSNDNNLSYADYKGWVEDGVLAKGLIKIEKGSSNSSSGNFIPNLIKTYTTSLPPHPNPSFLYQWTVPSGYVILSGQGTNTIQVQFPPTPIGGQIKVSMYEMGTSIEATITIDESNNIQNTLSGCYVTIEAWNTTDITKNFILEKHTFNIIGETGSRSFLLPTLDNKNSIKFLDRLDLETLTHKFYEWEYAFKLRYESWINLLGVNNAFINTANQNWEQYDNLVDWQIRFVLNVLIDDENI